MERRGFGRDARERGDCLRGDVGLLRGDPAVLDREIGRVARGPYPVDTGHLAANVDRDETADRTPGHTGHGGPVELGHCDEGIRQRHSDHESGRTSRWDTSTSGLVETSEVRLCCPPDGADLRTDALVNRPYSSSQAPEPTVRARGCPRRRVGQKASAVRLGGIS